MKTSSSSTDNPFSLLLVRRRDKIEIMKSAGITISKSPADIGKTLFEKLKA